jgi:uncharacterized protein
MNTQQGLQELKKHLKTKNLLKHCIAAEAIMRELAHHFGEDQEKWALAGLLHDIDYELTANEPNKHSLIGGDMLRGLGLDEDIIHSVITHNDVHGIERESLMDKALYCSDPMTGLIVAGALILPSKKIADVDESFILNRFNEKSFAKGADRGQIAACSELGLSLEEFTTISLRAMKNISSELGL